jgi:hypothetical protein
LKELARVSGYMLEDDFSPLAAVRILAKLIALDIPLYSA